MNSNGLEIRLSRALCLALIVVTLVGCGESGAREPFAYSHTVTEHRELLMVELRKIQAALGREGQAITPKLRHDLLDLLQQFGPVMNQMQQELYAYDAGKLWRDCVDKMLHPVIEDRRKLEAEYPEFAAMPLTTRSQRLGAALIAQGLIIGLLNVSGGYIMTSGGCNAKLAVEALKKSGWINEAELEKAMQEAE